MMTWVYHCMIAGTPVRINHDLEMERKGLVQEATYLHEWNPMNIQMTTMDNW